MTRIPLQTRRRLFQAGFFTLFLLAPPLDLLRLDLDRGHFILLGWDWTLGLGPFLHGEAGSGEAIVNLTLRGLLPVALIAVLLIGSAWRWGRLYCGWLCPHFSVVETINGLMRRASGKPSLWERRPLPEARADGRRQRPNPLYWLPTATAVVGFAFLWALTFLTYLLPPFEVYHNLLHGELSRNQALFLGVATGLLSIEFGFARHLFCRFGCAVGLFQSLAWMANRRAMVVGFDRTRARACRACNNACDHACPMRLKPRTIKRSMFTCTECGQCITACNQVQAPGGTSGLLRWVDGSEAAKISAPPLSPPSIASPAAPPVVHPNPVAPDRAARG